MPGIIQLNSTLFVLDTLIERVTCVEDQLSTTVKELAKSPDFSHLPKRESAWIVIQDSLSALQYALREARLAITTEPPTSTKTKSLSTLNDILEAIEESVHQTAQNTETIALMLEELGRELKTGTDG